MNDNKISHIVKENITSVSLIKNSVSNLNYLVNKKHVVRLKRHKDHFYSYKNEREVLHKNSSLYLSERVTYLDQDGNKVSDYIANSHTFKGLDKEIIEIAKMLNKLHNSNIKTHAKFKTLKRYFYYQKITQEKGFAHEEEIIKKVKHIYHHYPKVLCHNDVVSNNFLFTKNRSYLIDYEFAGMNIALFDIASFISENNIEDKKKIALFLEHYGYDLDNIDDLENMIMFTNLFWYYWANERYISTKEKIYLKIKDMKKKKIDNDLKALLMYKQKISELGKKN